MDFGLFERSGPKLGLRRWTSVARRRVLHVIIVALNFLHNDFKPLDLRLLGRRPNSLQRRMHRRLLALLTTCDAPGGVPIPAERSGPEFVARLEELERFASTFHAATFDNYEAGFGDCNEEPVTVGKIVKTDFVGQEKGNFSGVQPKSESLGAASLEVASPEATS